MAFSITSEYINKIGSDPKLSRMLSDYAANLMAAPPPPVAPPSQSPDQPSEGA
jgi:hypothetical protein